MQDNLDMYVVLVVVALAMVVGLWNNWVFHGPEGFSLTGEDRPSLLRFYATLLRHPIRTFEGSIFWPAQPSDSIGRRRL